ncbi:MAG: orotidine-5'-phosphate decarboxylase [Clostridia bacterium]|nr:orotidine-5'-phosphate decarboxylase [Clostridia bacterium]
MSMDLLIKKITQKKNPTVVGLDPNLEQMPPELLAKNIEKYGKTLKAAAEAIYEFNTGIIDSVCDIIPAVKPQSAYYEMYGPEGVEVLKRTMQYAREKDLYVIADVKRNDIGSTATAYAKAYLGEVEIAGEKVSPFGADCVTVNGYLGSDGLNPFINLCKEYNKSMFVLVKTSNPSSSELQDLIVGDKTIYRTMAEAVSKLGEDVVGEYGYSSVGFVVGATHPRELTELRAACPNSFFLVPGYGAQGATAEDLKGAFDKNGLGAIINSSRGIIYAWKKTDADFKEASRNAALAMKKDLEIYF